MEKFHVIVKTSANENKVVNENSELKVYLKSRPIDGKANLELVKFLSKYFGRKVKIISGFTSKRKLLCFE